MSQSVTIERIERYFEITEEARRKATPSTKNEIDSERLSTMLRMCDDYVSDARHFAKEGDLVSALSLIHISEPTRPY